MSDQFNFEVLWARIEREATRQFMQAFSRRSFIKAMMAGAAVTALSPYVARACAGQIESARALSAPDRVVSSAALPNGVAAGDVSQTSAILWTRLDRAGEVTFDVATTPDFASPLFSHAVTAANALTPVKVELTDLAPATTYHYRAVTADGEPVAGVFRTPAEVGEQIDGLRFGVSGDWRGELRPFVGIKNAPARDLAFFVLHGDTVYADIPSIDVTVAQATTPEEFTRKHAEVYSALYSVNLWAELRAATAVFATIDDHEVTNDFAGGATPASDPRFDDSGVPFINQTALYTNGLAAFQAYNPVRDEVYSGTGDPRMDGRPKLYRYRTFGRDAALFVLDARSFRDEAIEQIQDFFNPIRLIAYLRQMFTPGRTFLGRTQVEDLKRDLLAAQTAGILWKFVMIPEPIQHMGWFGGNDRWEGYAPERTEVLKFIEDNAIRNVVFVSADVHTTFINNITYQEDAGAAHIPTHCFEVSTGSVGFYPPTGQALVEGAASFGLLNEAELAAYQAADITEKDAVAERLFNQYVTDLQAFPRLGLADAPFIDARTVIGGNVVGHTFGWAEFDIAPLSGDLTITTYGVPAYSREQVAADPDAILALEPAIRSQIVVTPQMS